MGLKMKSMSRILQVLNGLESKAEEDDDTCEIPQANGLKFQKSQKGFENFNPNFTNPKTRFRVYNILISPAIETSKMNNRQER